MLVGWTVSFTRYTRNGIDWSAQTTEELHFSITRFYLEFCSTDQGRQENPFFFKESRIVFFFSRNACELFSRASTWVPVGASAGIFSKGYNGFFLYFTWLWDICRLLIFFWTFISLFLTLIYRNSCRAHEIIFLGVISRAFPGISTRNCHFGISLIVGPEVLAEIFPEVLRKIFG